MGTRVAFLDGVRGVAIGCVLLTHWFEPTLGWGQGGLLGVDVFFVLSGFIITTLLWRTDPGPLVARTTHFLGRRVRRLYPALAGVVVAATVLVALTPGAEPSGQRAAELGAAALAQLTWLVSATGADTDPFGVTWSLGIEWTFYLLWPWLVLTWRDRGWTAVRAARASLAIGAVCYLSTLAVDGDVFYVLPVPRFGELLAGAALALLVAHHREHGTRMRSCPTALVWCSVVAFAVYVVIAPWAVEAWQTRFVGIPLATATTLLILWWHYAGGTGLVETLLTWSPLVALGRISYSLYLWHAVPASFLDVEIAGSSGALAGAAFLGLSVVAALASYRWLERPFTGSRAGILAAPGAPVTPSDTRA
ncbi:acyltransferase [Nocardioides sp. R-C-SC26]|uniref:acyltransferase family protein n=1 Tax=Nocardioides sp. R-C-SC26 TaxID=2870414 RepID=UPI0022B774C5|nr:acyltransferase [Nocardioides sp. R-C-SC26]